MAFCYRDMTFCSAAERCKNSVGCYRHFDRMHRAKADLWAIQMGLLDEDNNPAPPVAFMDFSKICSLYEEKQ